MKKLLLLDCDGTLRQPQSGAKFIQHPRDQEIIPGADKAIAHYAGKGWICVGITNQGGVAAQLKSLDDAIAEQQFTLSLLPQLNSIFFCPDFEGKDCWYVSRGIEALSAARAFDIPWFAGLSGQFRKPDPGMLLAAHKNYVPGSPIFDAWFIGDRAEDEAAAVAAGINFLWADTWRNRFLPGIHEIQAIGRKQIEFLEGI